MEINQIYKIYPSTIHAMQRRLILLWNTCKTYKDSQTLNPTQTKTLDLWEHIQDCRDKDCGRKHCWSSCRILDHFHRCKVSNRRSACKLCAPVIQYFTRDSCGNNKVTNRQDSEIQMETKKQFNQISDGNKPSIGYTLKRVPEEIRNSQTAVTSAKRNTLSQKQRCIVIRCDKSVEGGHEEDLVPHAIQTIDVKKQPLLLQGVQPYTNKQAYKREKARNIRNPNCIIPSGRRSVNNSLSDTSIKFEVSCITKEDRKDVVAASILLIGMKKRTWGEMVTQ